MDLFNGMDWGAYNTFRDAAHRLRGADQWMLLATWLGSYAACPIILVLAVIVAPRPGRARVAGVVVVTFLVGCLVIEGVSGLTQRPRPADSQNTLGSAGTYASFPSRGVFLAAFAWQMLALAFERRFKNRAVSVVFYAIAALAIVFVCVSQLWLGLHWVTDVLAGLAGGVGLALVGRWGTASAGFGVPHPAA